jgi:hypothetical protein
MQTVKFDFDELIIAIDGRNDNGMLLYGSADLEPNGPTIEYGFYVSAIYLAQGTKLEANSRDVFERELFKRMAAVIENAATTIGRHAAVEYGDANEQEAA